MSQTNSKTIRCSGFTQRWAFPGTSCIHSLSSYPCLANENLILPSTGIHFWRWMKFQCQAQVALLISYRNKWRRGRCVGSYTDGDATALDASGISLFNCCCNALRSLLCPCRVIWGRWGGHASSLRIWTEGSRYRMSQEGQTAVDISVVIRLFIYTF